VAIIGAGIADSDGGRVVAIVARTIGLAYHILSDAAPALGVSRIKAETHAGVWAPLVMKQFSAFHRLNTKDDPDQGLNITVIWSKDAAGVPWAAAAAPQ